MAGLLSTLLGIGGGVVVVPMLLLLFGLDTKVAVGTSLAYIVPVAMAGAVQHGLRGQWSLKIALIAIPLGLVGSYLGMKVSDSLGSLAIKRIFGVLMLLVGLKLLLLPEGWNGLLMKPDAAEEREAQAVAAESADDL
jgi:uncharacterized membrane protein YfcA